MAKYVYSFNEGSKDMRGLLGGKGANLAEMTSIGLPVPFGFTVTTEACTRYYEDGETIDSEIEEEIFGKLKELEDVTGKKFGDLQTPLLVSVRSGSPFSMPGMMDTVLNLGMNDETAEAMIKLTGDESFVMDSYKRFIQMFADVVKGVDKKKFDIEAEKTNDLKQIIVNYKEIYKQETGEEFPQNPQTQLMEAVRAVFRSWNNERAVLYRKLNDIPDNLGTAVNVQAMVFGNMGDDSCTGVAFTRNPASGKRELFGEFLINAQGEDVVAGIRTPQPISEMKENFPDVYSEFERIAALLERHYTDVQDMEFTVEKNKLYMLQTRNAKRTAQAAVKIAVDMEQEGLIDKETAVMRIDPSQIDQLLHHRFDEEALKSAKPMAKGLPASPGAACGAVYFDAASAEAAFDRGEKVVLVRQETSPEDLAGMVAAEGIMTSRGGMTSHAAVVARGMGKCCVAGCSEVIVDEIAKSMKSGDIIIGEGDYISIDGNTGNVYPGRIATVAPEMSGDFAKVMTWADEIRTMKVRTNADNPRDAKQAVEFGAEGIGLCRTEHMFFDEDRISDMRKMILASDREEREKALAKLLPYQKEDFKGIFEVMEDRPVNIRLLDPPLHEFLPSTEKEINDLAQQMGISPEKLRDKVTELKEFNPMLGHRGCRLAVTYPEIAKMQTEAIITAAMEVKEEKNIDIEPEIMIPLVGIDRELAFVRATVEETISEIFKKTGKEIGYQIGTMIEIPRAALTADEIAEEAEFFSFGTNDLTQMTFGFSRDDTGKILKEYTDKNILKNDPFMSIDTTGVGKLMEMAIELGKKTRPNIKLGICGEHGGEPASVEYCYRIGLNYVSCSPYRVPIARLAAAQAVIRDKNPQQWQDR
ncbi:pyruvate, phosphate dikinase [Gallibacter intestinalis]|uniref:Pyruvate, phosphate dikinase n=1 Tax=Gallibacter intestinalis TaxID=2779356 RepID=A0ABR9QXK1_9FIRM|nr:pyruvate, phosphate dikinase [Gallibacter intestinalis]MBE5035628.1 pyruvate, phosphate dikinase [Gallibacter intestinalis]